MPNDYPKTLQRGVFKGRTFNTAGEYATALADAKAQGLVKERGRNGPSAARSANGVTRPMAESLVSYANIVLAVVPQTREDTLDETECEALILGIIETARANKYFANIIVKTCQLQSGSRLAFAVGAVVARRVARREILPPEARIPVELGASLLLSMLAQEGPSTEPAQIEQPPEAVSPNGHSDIAPGEIVDPFSVAAR